MANIRIIITFIFATLHLGAWAQFNQFKNQLFFRQFNTDKGLSQASVNCILQDSQGFMWFGTDDGLNRFDGSQFKIFRHTPGDSTTIVGNTVEALLEDEKGNIWIGTTEGLSRLDRHLEQFTNYSLTGFEYYSCVDLKVDKKRNRLWMANTVNGVCYIDLTTGIVKKLPIYKKMGEIMAYRIELIEDNLYVGTLEKGLLKINVISGIVEEVVLGYTRSGMPHHFSIRELILDGKTLWIGTQGGGLKKLNTVTRELKTFSQSSKHISDDKVWAVAPTKDGRIWVGTDGGGLTLLNPTNGTSLVYKHSDYTERSISSNTIRSILVDESGNSWFGTFNGGVSYHADFNINMLSFRRDPENPLSLSHNAVLSFCEVEDSTLMIGTDGGGLNYLKEGKFYEYSFPNHVDNPTVITCFHKSANGKLLIGTYQHGLYIIHPDKKVDQYKNDPVDNSSISSDIVWDIAEDSKGNYWLATERGINRFNEESRSFTHFHNRTPKDNKLIFTDSFIQSIIIDAEQMLWGGQYGILISYDLIRDVVKTYTSVDNSSQGLPNKQILSIVSDPRNKGTIWFSAQGSALVRFQQKEERFTTLTEQDGLPNSLIFAVQLDTDGNVWATTGKGLVKYDPVKKHFYLFGEDHGVDTGPFKDNATLATSQGYLLFGGTNGFTAFKPVAITHGEGELNITFTGFQFFNEEAKIDNNILKKNITNTKSIDLPYEKAKFITFKFSALQFLSPNSIQYEYMLEGFDNSWHSVENRSVSFTNLSPGDYKLRIRAGYISGAWGKESIMAITVIPEWWMTIFTKVTALILFFVTVYFIYRYRTYQLKQRKYELERIVAEQNQQIWKKNLELETRNEELSQHNEELIMHRETISYQNMMLNEAQEQLQVVNQSLEGLVQQRTVRLNETIDRLNKTIKELDAFLYSASHDLVAPLKSILGLVNLAKLETNDTDKDLYFMHIEKSVRKLEGMIHTLMQHSFNAKAVSDYKKADIRTVVQESVADLLFMPEAAKIEFEYHLDNAIVLTDIPRLKIILANLLSNAIKYSDEKKDQHNISLSFSRSDTFWILEIKDNGIGIDEERLSKVFDLFYRATENAKGSGLGLYIVKEAVERMEGEISVESIFGLWTKFVLKFPLYEQIDKKIPG